MSQWCRAEDEMGCSVIHKLLNSGRKHWATRFSAHSFACFKPLTLLARSAELIRSLAPPSHSLQGLWDSAMFYVYVWFFKCSESQWDGVKYRVLGSECAPKNLYSC